MTASKQRAEEIAAEALAEAGYPEAFAHGGTEERIIELLDQQKVRDCEAWIVRFVRAPSWVEFAVDKESLQVVRTEKSRGARGRP